MELMQVRGLLPARMDAATWAVLVVCALVIVGLVVSVVVPWIRQRRERERIERGDYYGTESSE